MMTTRPARRDRARRIFAGALALASCASVASAAPRMPLEFLMGPRVQATSADGIWTELRPGPRARAKHVAVYDANHNRMIVFGGRCLDACCPGGAVPADVWVLPLDADTPEWIEVHPTGVTPVVNLGPAAIYDPVRDRLLVPTSTKIWVLTLSTAPAWSELIPAGTAPTSIVSAVYDPVRDRMLVLAATGRVWALDFAGAPTWVELAPTGKVPSQLKSAIYDPARDRVVVFADSVRALVLSSTAWEALAATQAPTGHSAICDAPRDRAIIYGGCQGVDCGLPNTWAFTFADNQWTMIDSNGPVVSYQSTICDPSHDRMIVFGGYSILFYNEKTSRELWALSLDGSPTWAEYTPQLPPRACGIPVIRDPVRDRMIAFDGAVQAMDLSARPYWNTIPALGTTPSARHAHSAIYDPVRDRMVLFGGIDGAMQSLQDVWELSLGDPETWTPLSPTGTPPDTAKPAVYDPVRDRMLVVGGDHVSELSFDGPLAWSELTVSGSPPGGLYDFDAVYDPIRDRVLVFGGVTSSGPSSDTWALDLSPAPAWSLLPPGGTPPDPRSGAMAIYDSARDRLVVSGGTLDGDVKATDSWELVLSPSPEWHQLAPDVLAQGGLAAIYDPAYDRMVSVGLCTTVLGCPDPTPRAWALWFNQIVGVPETRPTSTLSLAQNRPNPARGELAISFSIARPGRVTLRVHDISGRVVKTLFDGELRKGEHTVQWNGQRDDGARVRPGTYFYDVNASGERMSRRMILLR